MSEKKLGGSDTARAARLAEQLRANLRKRKAQARASGNETSPENTGPKDTG